jgi:three-Cys-motif partner protein
MVELKDYSGREQAYVKHIFLERYLEALVFKTASSFDHVVYVDGFAGPWQSANEKFEDTSFGIALSALRRAKETWKKNGRDVKMTALLVETDDAAYARLTTIPPKYPDIIIKTYHADFLSIISAVLKDIPDDAFVFFLIDPKGWRIPLAELEPLLARPNSEIIFNFMFEFINRAASMTDPGLRKGLDELMPYGDWHHRMEEAVNTAGHPLTPNERKEILVEAFSESLRPLGGYRYVAETTVLRPLRDRPLYCLFYATRHKRGISVFRECQVTALKKQSATRAATKVQRAATKSGQSEMFASLHDMGPNDTNDLLERERHAAEMTIKQITPKHPNAIKYKELWPLVLSRHVVRLTDVNKICAELRKKRELVFLNWEDRARVPKDHFLMQRP